MLMSREEALHFVRSHWREIIPEITDEAQEKVNGETSWVCPCPTEFGICGHGAHGDGLTRNPLSRDGNGLHCFSCGFSGDIIDLFRAVHPEFSYNEVLTNMAGEFGITVEPYKPAGGPTSASKPQGNINTQPERKSPQEAAQRPTAQTRDFSAYYTECWGRLNDPAAVAYLTSRGISLDTARGYYLGYDPQADPAGKGHPTPRIIIPVTEGHYIGRAIDPHQSKYKKMNNAGAVAGIFNERALYAQGVQEAFVVEGAFDALSILEAGATAIALNSTSNAKNLIADLEQQGTDAVLILCFDKDPDPNTRKKVQEQRRELEAGLTRLGQPYIVADVCGDYKDPNDFLIHDRQGFFDAVADARAQNAGKPDNISHYIDQLMGSEIEAFHADVKTGFSNLDEKCGGLYTGLYVVAAISSLGKTTFCHQMADQISEAGTDVLYFSLEQSRLEMVTKSIARITAQTDLKNAVTSLSIRKGYLPAQVQTAAMEYKRRVGDRVSIVESNLDCNIATISDYIRRYIARNGVKPVVFIDYLQILQPMEQNGRRQTTKEVVDDVTTQLKRMSRELGLTVIAISSVNRNNYLTPIDFESLKESGSIEYTADVVWGLQLHCLSDASFDKMKQITAKREKVAEEKVKVPRDIDLVCLKNRYGPSSFKCRFDYYQVNDLFRPASPFAGAEPPRRRL